MPSYFYSRPCGRGDLTLCTSVSFAPSFLLTPLREGRHGHSRLNAAISKFLLTPLREGRPVPFFFADGSTMYFYSRPCGRGDEAHTGKLHRSSHFYSRPCGRGDQSELVGQREAIISTHAPAGGATSARSAEPSGTAIGFLLTPLREGRPGIRNPMVYSLWISTHAPAGGATAIFHKSVMRFCGKLPKDDTVLCLASFGFPRRDPKAVYLAWISCANLPQKCVRQGLALKDQGTSCFHVGLASHAFDPVLV